MNIKTWIKNSNKVQPMFVHFDQYNYKEPEGYGNSFLFAGCSITANVGLDEVPASGFGGWSRFLTEMLQDELEISAVNNCSISGASTFEIISNVFRFLNNYHKPNFIFLLLPPIHRESSSYARNVSAAQIIDYNIFSILHNYCKENNISLFASTWDFYISGITDWFVDDTNSDLSEKTLKEFDSFFIPNKKEFSKNVFEASLNGSLSIEGGDCHPASPMHMAYARMFYEEYKKRKC